MGSPRPLPSPREDRPYARLLAAVRSLAADLEAGARVRCAHRGVDDVCALPGPCRNRRRRAGLPVCGHDPHEVRG